MRYLWLLLFISAVGLIHPQQKGFFSTEGKEILDPQGKPVLLKGIGLGNWLVPEGYMFKFEKVSSPRLIYDLFDILLGEREAEKFWNKFRTDYITHEDIKFLKKCGFNSIRIPFNYRLFVTDDEKQELTGPGYALLDSAVKWCREEYLPVVLDMHCAPGGQTGDNIDDSYGYPFLFESEENINLTIKIWTKLADTYKNDPIVIGYDLLNEPIAHYFDKDKLNPLLEPFFKRLTAAIRTVDKNHIIFIAGAQWNSNFSVFGKPFDDNLVYTFHKYWTPATKDVVQDYIDFGEKYQVPIWMGESGENTNEWITEFRTMLEKENIGWCFWPYKKLNSERGITSIVPPKDYDLITTFANKFDVSYGYIRDNKPDQAKIKTILAQYLENIKLKNCFINSDYLKALGL
jgi:aryl-phospho-beta-D-glucosidase BglC (GH1 family)